MIDPLVFEEWKYIDFWDIKPGAYKISNFGRVYSNLKNGLLSPAISNGYLTVSLAMEDGSRKTFYIHRLVGFAFVYNPNPENCVEINHINLHRNDCFAGNLEWTTKQENIDHELAHFGHGIEQEKATKSWSCGKDTYGENNGMAILTELDVRIMLGVIQDGGSYAQALSEAGIEINLANRANLSHIVRGHRWKHISCEYVIPSKIPRK